MGSRAAPLSLAACWRSTGTASPLSGATSGTGKTAVRAIAKRVGA